MKNSEIQTYEMKFLNYIMHTHSKKRSINVTTVGGSDKVYNETPYGVKQFKGTPAKYVTVSRSST